MPALSLPLLAGYFAVVLLVAKAGLMFAPQIPPLAAGIENPESFLNRWFLIAGIPLPAFLYWFRTRTVLLYVVGLRRGALQDSIFDRGRDWLAENPAVVWAPPRPWLTGAALFAQFCAWFGVFALLYAQQFLNNVGPCGWIDYLFWLPWFSYSV